MEYEKACRTDDEEVKQHVVKWSCSAVRLGNDDIPAIMGGHLEGEIDDLLAGNQRAQG